MPEVSKEEPLTERSLCLRHKYRQPIRKRLVTGFRTASTSPTRMKPASLAAVHPSLQLWPEPLDLFFAVYSFLFPHCLLHTLSTWKWPPDRQRGCFSPPTPSPTGYSVTRPSAQQPPRQRPAAQQEPSIAIDDDTSPQPRGDTPRNPLRCSVSAPAPHPLQPPVVLEAAACHLTSPIAARSPPTRLSGSFRSRRHGLSSGWASLIVSWSPGWPSWCRFWTVLLMLRA